MRVEHWTLWIMLLVYESLLFTPPPFPIDTNLITLVIKILCEINWARWHKKERKKERQTDRKKDITLTHKS
jgi:hypothetical protein